MPLFLKTRDLQLFRRVSKQLVQSIMDVQVTYIKLDTSKMKSNLYGETKRGILQIYKRVNLHCLVQHSPQQTDYENNISYNNSTIFKFLISTLQQKDVVPQIGDFIMWNNQYWQITSITQQQLIGNSSNIQWSKIVQTTVVSDSKVKQLLAFKD